MFKLFKRLFCKKKDESVDDFAEQTSPNLDKYDFGSNCYWKSYESSKCVTPTTGALPRRKYRRKGGGFYYIRTHTVIDAFDLHLEELKERGAEIEVDGLTITWWYN